MLRQNAIFIMAAVMLMGGVAAGQQPEAVTGPIPTVYVSSPADDTIYQVTVPDDGYPTVVPVYYEQGSDYRDLVFGPDEKLYACDPSQGKIIRFFPAPGGTPDLPCFESYCIGLCSDGIECFNNCMTSCLNGDDICDADCSLGGSVIPEVVYSGQGRYECGWFNSTGDLLVVNDRVEQNAGVWAFLGVGANDDWSASDPVPFPVDDPFPDIPSLGLTQFGDGDLLVPDAFSGAVERMEFSPATGFEPSIGVSSVITDTVKPIGIARLSSGDVFLAEDEEVGNDNSVPVMSRWTYDATTDSWAKDPDFECEFLAEGDYHRPFYVEAAADDTLYVATSYLNEGSDDAWGILWRVDPSQQYCNEEHLFDFFFPNQDQEAAVGLALSNTSVASPQKTVGDDGYVAFNFNDHVFEVIDAPAECSAVMTSVQTPPACLDRLLLNNEINATPRANYEGEGAFSQVYYVDGVSCEGEIDKAISAYIRALDYPTMIACHAQPGVDLCDPLFVPSCEKVPLTGVDPFGGLFEGDGRIAGRSDSFSQYFLAEGNPAPIEEAGEWCRFWFPLWDVDSPDAGCMPTFPSGWIIPVKFRLAAADGGHCWWGPWKDDASLLLTMSRVRDEQGNSTYDPVDIQCLGHDCEGGARFPLPNRPWKPYVLRLFSCGLPAGVYQLTVTSDNGEIPMQYTFLRLVGH